MLIAIRKAKKGEKVINVYIKCKPTVAVRQTESIKLKLVSVIDRLHHRTESCMTIF